MNRFTDRPRISWIPVAVACILLVLTPLVRAGSEAADRGGLKEVIETRSSPHRFQTTVTGNVDESRFLWPNLPGKTTFYTSVRITNAGRETIVNPRLTINGFQMPLTTKELIRALTLDTPDDMDRILRIFNTMTRHVVHENMPDAVPVYPLGFFLNHGYGVCFDQMGIQAQLWEVMGLPWRVAAPVNHATAEVKHPRQNRTMLLDTNMNAYYLKHDNWSIASAQDVREDPMLILRSTHERYYHRSPWQEGDPIVDMWGSSEKMAALYGTAPSRPLDSTRFGPHLDEKWTISLRPGESYGWHSDTGRYHDNLKQNPAILNVARQLTWETDLDLEKLHHRWFLSRKGLQRSDRGSQGVALDHRQVWKIPYHLAFPVLGMTLALKPDPDSPNQTGQDGTLLRIELKTPKKSTSEEVPLEKLADRSYSLDALLNQLPYPVKDVEVSISLKPGKGSSSKGLNINGLQIRLFCQSTAFACRSLQQGRNQIIYADASRKRDVRVTVEVRPETVPLPSFSSSGPFSPGSGEELPESALIFRWPAADEQGGIVGYQWQLSAHRDMRYPLSPTFERLVDGKSSSRNDNQITFRLPWRGMLPVGRELYWRVRPYSDRNLAGDWSPVRSFRLRGPGAPQNVRLAENGSRSVLTWEPDPQGTAPEAYEIHTSSLEGFMPTDKNHRILGMGLSEVMKYRWEDVYATDWPSAPPTFLITTGQKQWTVIDENGPATSMLQKPGTHYRIIAIDAEGSRSCPSPQIHLPHPRIVSPGKMALPPGPVYWQVPFISSLGRVMATTPDYRLGLWEKSTLAFSLLNVPPGLKGWSIDRNTGIIQGRLAGGETVPLTVEILDAKYGIRNVKRIVFQGK